MSNLLNRFVDFATNTLTADVNNTNTDTTNLTIDGNAAEASVATTATASGDGTTQVFQLSHSLGSTPTSVSVVPTSEDASTDFWITDKTSTFVEITYAAAPATGTDNLTYDVTLNAPVSAVAPKLVESGTNADGGTTHQFAQAEDSLDLQSAGDISNAATMDSAEYQVDGNTALTAVAASGQVTLASGTAVVDTGLSATDATFSLALGIDDPNADAKITGRLFWDDSAGTYQVEIVEDGTSVGNPTVNYDVVRVR